ncbi:MAG: hypothetical protein IH998_05730, partial [Proteobacteria bacterium]|nr:hypothetical protein [Pseudomonadota bacterium]
MEMEGQIGRAIDLYFIHGGGKGQLGTLARAYRSLKTSTAVIADLDLMRNEAEISDVISALGGDFAATDGLFRSVHSALSSRPPITSVKKFVARARTILQDSEKRESVSTENRRELLDLKHRRMVRVVEIESDEDDVGLDRQSRFHQDRELVLKIDRT